MPVVVRTTGASASRSTATEPCWSSAQRQCRCPWGRFHGGSASELSVAECDAHSESFPGIEDEKARGIGEMARGCACREGVHAG